MAIAAVCLGVFLLPGPRLAGQIPSSRVETRLVEVPVVVGERKTGETGPGPMVFRNRCDAAGDGRPVL